MQGWGVKENKREAFDWAYKAAKNGDADMAFSLWQYAEDNTLAKRFNFSMVEEEENKAKIVALVNVIRNTLQRKRRDYPVSSPMANSS